jgi:isoquinoline 1-oxidoreductase subunit beta
MKKRHFLLWGTGLLGAVTVGWGVLPPRQRLQGDPLPVKDGQVALNAWLTLNADGTVLLAMPKSEMGQGVHTALAMLVAEELDIALEKVRIEQSPIGKIYGNVAAVAGGVPFRDDDDGTVARTARWMMVKVARELGIMMTGGSSSVKDLWQPLREAAAMVRAYIDNGHKLPETYQPKAAKDYKLLGQPTRRVDAAAKTNGSAMYGIDGVSMLYAAIKHAPARKGTVVKLSEGSAAKVKAMLGIKAVVVLPSLHDSTGGVAVVATSYWQAKQALDQLEVEWNAAGAASSNATVTQALEQGLEGDSGFTFYKQGDAKGILSQATLSKALTVSATYSAPYLAHATMEPMSGSISLTKIKDQAHVTLTIGTQVPDLVQNVAVDILKLSKEFVHVKVPYLGGGFGRRLEVDAAAQLAWLAKEVLLPSQNESTLTLIWSREEDTKHDFYRPAAVAKFDATLDNEGRIASWVNKSAAQSITPQYMRRNAGLPLTDPDKTNSEGAFDQAYEFPAAHVSHKAVDLPIPVGFWRSVGHSHQAFFKESFLDECMHAAIKQGALTDPLQYRKDLLKRHPRHQSVLNVLMVHSGLTPPEFFGVHNITQNGIRYQASWGLALHESFGTIVAMLALVTVADGQIKVLRVDSAIDCGFCVNPLGVAAQVESSVVFGLSAALWGKVDLKDGAAQQSNFHDYRVMRMSECPQINTYIVPSTRPPEGVGEPALPPLAPAVANALFVLTGKRLRSLPLQLT